MNETKFEIGNSKFATGPRGPVKDFTDLKVWQLGRELRRHVYEHSKRFPPDEKHALTSQIRRAAVSITANIAEGFGRFSYQENMQFCRHARGSAFELRDHLIAALDAGYLIKKDWKELDELAQRTIQVLNGYIRSTRELQGMKNKQ
jgi:four helix bundle protein